jgi:hypothetical protein
MRAFLRLWPAGLSSVVVLSGGLITGCVVMDDGGNKDGDDSPQSETVTWSSPDEDTGEGSFDLPSVTVSWGAESVSLDVSDGGNWQLGMAETGGSCGAGVPCWTGEDCHLGYVSADGTAYGPYCHAISDGLLELSYGGNLTDLEAGTTVFQEAFLGTVTYVVEPSDGDLPCLVFGDDPSYYNELDCLVLSL